MRIKLTFALAVLAFAVASCTARAAAPQAQNLSHSELKTMMQNAHSTEDFLTLASYFRWREAQFDQKAHEELTFWAQRSMNVSLAAAKYPRPEDSAKNRYEYFVYESQKMSAQAARYENLAASTSR
jgi:hypothetical protein